MPQFTPKAPISLTDAAISRVRHLLAAQSAPAQEQAEPNRLRAFVTGGGCSGFRYCFEIDQVVDEDDTQIQAGEHELVIDSLSLPYLINSTIDYLEDLEGARFVVKNPNAESTCGCGASFSMVAPPTAESVNIPATP